jgi:hypothetical protein
MTSVLNVDTIADKAGTGPVALTKQVATKGWLNLNGTGTIAARDSFNFSSHTDGGTGYYTSDYTNAMSDANYCHSHHNVDDAPLQYGLTQSASFSATASNITQRCGGWSGVSSDSAISSDSERHSLIIMGDLA